jgi:PTS system cellobiose-specific IIA component
VHSQDHLMTAITFVDLATSFVDVYEQLTDLKK